MSEELSRKQLEDYLDLEKKIQKLESKNALTKSEMTKQRQKETEDEIKMLKFELEECKKKTKKEKQDVDNMGRQSTRDAFSSPEDFNKELTREREEYFEALNNEEIARSKLKTKEAQKEDLKKDAKKFEKKAEELKDLYKKRDELLANIFNGEYGSPLENQLEAAYDEFMDKKNRVNVAFIKWKNARILLNYAIQQLSYAVKLWADAATIPPSSSQATVKYNCVTECRNNLVAAVQNMDSCQKHLSNIKFPYCNQEEMLTLGRATANIYSDVQDPRRHQHANQCYSVTLQRAAALLQWFDSVINQTIKVDLEQVTKAAKETEVNLRQERIRLLQEKVRESGGSLKGLEKADNLPLDDDEFPEGCITKPEDVDTDSELTQVKKKNEPEFPGPTPVPLAELAPIPTNEEIFGKISHLKEQYEKDKEGYQQVQDVNKARMEQNLHLKREERRRRHMNTPKC